MIARRTRSVALWSLSLAAALWIVVHARYVNDLSAFLPANPTPMQRLLIDQLRDGPASRLILIALEGGDARARATAAAAMARRLRQEDAFSSVDDGESLTRDRDREFLFRHRYLLSDAVTPQHFSANGLRESIENTIDDLASSSGLLLKSLVPRDPTGEMLRIVDQLALRRRPSTQDGAWVSADGKRTLLVAQTVAAGSDTDAQERALDAVRSAFGAAAGTRTARGSTAGIRLRMSGPGVFAVAARAKIKRAATRLSVISSVLVIAVLFSIYRSLPALCLGLLPVASGALLGVAAVAVVFGAVHGITLGFGITLIGESVDYSIYFFIQSSRRGSFASGDEGAWRKAIWPTVRLGMLTSVCGFASLLPSGFPGLAQLGLYSISGLITAALVTRFLLPELLPRGFEIRDVSPLGSKLGEWRDWLRRAGGGVLSGGGWLLAATALLVLYAHHGPLWNRELSALSPVSTADLRYDATLRGDLGAADVLDLVVVSGPTLEAVLQGAERAASPLRSLIDAKLIGDFDTPSAYLPSLATQQARRSALPDKATLLDNLHNALAGLDLRGDRLSPFLDDVESARHADLLMATDLRGTSLAAGFGTLILHQDSHWSALLPLHAPPGDAVALPHIEVARVRGALAAAGLPDTQVLDVKAQTDALYQGYLDEAIRLSLAGFVLIALLLSSALRSARRVMRILLPLALAVLTVAAGLVAFGQQLTILHLVGMLLIVAVGSNYALFFDREGNRQPQATAALTLASLVIANVSTVIGFGLLSFSQVPVLEALGTTVGPGAFLALVFSALMASPPPAVATHA